MAKTSSSGKGLPNDPNPFGSLGSTSPAVVQGGGSFAPGGRYVRPIVPIQTPGEGQSIYYLLHNVWDPRTLQAPDTTIDGIQVYPQRFSSTAPGFDFLGEYYRHVMYRLFAGRPGINQPPAALIGEVIDVISDVSRMLGIYYSMFAMRHSMDPRLFRRLDICGLDKMDEMQAALKNLPLPKTIAYLNSRYIGLKDVSETGLFQNVGFLVAGGYEQFLQLWSNVNQRINGLSWARLMFPTLGLLGDNFTTSDVDPDFLQVFINAHYRGTTAVNGQYAPYVLVKGAGEEPEKLASIGILSCVRSAGEVPTDDRTYTQTGWGTAGFGIDRTGSLVNSQRTFVPQLCMWKDASQRDAVITRSVTQAASANANLLNSETIANASMAANVVHEYNMNFQTNFAAYFVRTLDTVTGNVIAGDFLSDTDTHYRVSHGYGITNINYTFNTNFLNFAEQVMFDN